MVHIAKARTSAAAGCHDRDTTRGPDRTQGGETGFRSERRRSELREGQRKEQRERRKRERQRKRKSERGRRKEELLSGGATKGYESPRGKARMRKYEEAEREPEKEKKDGLLRVGDRKERI